MRRTHLFLIVAGLSLLRPLDPGRPVPERLRGTFIDDYQILHRITDSSWSLGSLDRYRIVASNDSARYLIAQNDSNNASDPGKWTRIDWMELPMPPYEWAFCLIEYKAESRTMAEANTSADREHPRTGCNGFPFSRMRRTAADSSPRPY